MSDAFTVTALSPMRKIIAARMKEASQTIPHFRISAEVEASGIIALRGELVEQPDRGPLSLNDLLIKACAAALMDVPALNAQWADKEIHHYHSADIAVVVAVNGGLVTPIIRSAEAKSIWDISREVREKIAKAMRNELKMEEIVGGSFSISNLGMHGVDQFDAIINPPQCAILAVGAAKPRPVVAANGELRAATILRVTLSVDHRAIDGSTAATFLSALRGRIERPHYLVPGEG